jgi:hypothetical protein
MERYFKSEFYGATVFPIVVRPNCYPSASWPAAGRADTSLRSLSTCTASSPQTKDSKLPEKALLAINVDRVAIYHPQTLVRCCPARPYVCGVCPLTRSVRRSCARRGATATFRNGR